MQVRRSPSSKINVDVAMALRTLGVPVDAQFVGLTWGKFTGEGFEDWEAKSVIITPDADPFLARAAVLTLSQEALETLYAGLRRPIGIPDSE